MPWKLVFYLVLLGLVLAFVWLNIGNTTDISFGFATVEDVPIFMSLFVSFFIGVAVALPIAVRSSSRKTRAQSEKRAAKREAKRRNRREKRPAKGKDRVPSEGESHDAVADSTHTDVQ